MMTDKIIGTKGVEWMLNARTAKPQQAMAKN